MDKRLASTVFEEIREVAGARLCGIAAEPGADHVVFVTAAGFEGCTILAIAGVAARHGVRFEVYSHEGDDSVSVRLFTPLTPSYAQTPDGTITITKERPQSVR